MLYRQQPLLVCSQGTLVLTTLEEASRYAEPGVGFLAEEAFVAWGQYDKKGLAHLQQVAGLPVQAVRRPAERAALWQALTACARKEFDVGKYHKARPDENMATLPEADKTPRRKNTRTPMECTLKLTEVKPRRKRGAALRRYNLYRDGMTVQEYCDAGGIPWDIWYDTLYGYITLWNPDGTPFVRPDHVA